MAYDHVIDYARIVLVVIDMEEMINNLSARKLCFVKNHLDVMRCAVHASRCTILYFIIPHLVFIIFSVFYLYHTISSSDIPQEC